MKKLLKIFLFLAAPLYAQTALPNTTKVAQEWINVTVPAGLKLIAQFGCPINAAGITMWWSKSFSVSGLIPNDWWSLGMGTQPVCFGLPSLYVQQGAAPVTLTVLTNPATTVIVPASSGTPPPPLPSSITFPIPIKGTCTWTGTSTNGTTLIITLTCTSP